METGDTEGQQEPPVEQSTVIETIPVKKGLKEIINEKKEKDATKGFVNVPEALCNM
jgi:hypothetical protein